MNNLSPIRRDFLASHIRSQLGRLMNILNNIEEERGMDSDRTNNSLKEVEFGIRQIRKLCQEN